MATVTASSNIVSRISHVNMSTVSCESKTAPMRIGYMRKANTHNGLRIMNSLDELLNRNSIKMKGVQSSWKKGLLRKSVRPKGIIICGLNLIFVGTEVAPWSKTGGLGDVLGGLPPALAANGHRVMTIAPRYDQYKDAWDTSVSIEVWGKTGTKIYGPAAGDDYQDNQLRFSLFCQAALEAARVLNLESNKYFSGPYGEDVIFVANDWHTALISCYLKSMYQSIGLFRNAKVVFCIHNIAYQGRFAFADYSLLNLPDQFKSSFDFLDGHVKPVVGRKINWMKAGILESHLVLTVSPYYAQELVSGPDKGVELDNILRRTGVTGIVNGMDVQEWNPSTDKYITVKYDDSTVLEGKALLKEALQAEVGLPVDKNIPLIAFIGRLEEQKGSDILVAAIPQFIKENVQIVALGTGKKEMEKQLQELEISYPDKARGVAKFNVPIVASTGGLVDTVKEGFTGFQMGSFNVELMWMLLQRLS
ncbi:hypothetical protein TSUD_359870 [Trifolium subterraneum]|uniref:Starch synthase catalytic domain-containing protein n=1 Tax=Trifolium subterraneum TaxID=3900 RepID=A0A2Z6NU50_TRISU|nr:hypothetical protein TSUD_359870 [Trifolium subterraneum]